MTCKSINRRRAGLTLIETVVAIGLLSSVSALLVPTLSTARGDAKRLTCQSHLGQLAQALIRYHADLDGLPILIQRSSNGTVLGWTSWTFGGWSGRNREYWASGNGFGNIQTNERPLSVYMTPWEIQDEVDPLTPTQEMPLFKCPSDNRSAQWQWGGNYSIGLSAYDDVGTSYPMNFAWWSQTGDMGVPPGEDSFTYRVEAHGPQIYEKYMNGDSARFITLLEDPGNYGLAIGGGSPSGIQTMGYHGEFSTHMAGFSDGHAEYLYMDTRHRHDSLPNPPGPRHGAVSPFGRWTACDENKEHPSGGRHE